MPNLLKDGNDQFYRMRRIHPSDPVTKLDYYIPTPSTPSSSSSSAISNRLPTRFDRYSTQGFSSDHSQIGTNDRTKDILSPRRQQTTKVLLATEPEVSFIRHRRRIKEDADKRSSIMGSESPVQTSGFSDGTLVDRTESEEFDKVHMLQDKNCYVHKDADCFEGISQRKRNTINHNRIIDELISSSFKDKLSNLRQPQARLRRRKIRRQNRRLVLNGEDFQAHNEYALSELFSQSEIPGFREIFASDSYLRKFCWIIAFLFMTVLSLNDATELITEYFEYPITVDVRLKDSARLPFPAVTVCNLNVVRFSALCSSSSSFDLANQIPSDLRDKLCGIQVEKKKNGTGSGGDSDIADINNIGITTTTSSTTSASTSALPTTNISSDISTEPTFATTRTKQDSSSSASNHTGSGDIDEELAVAQTTVRAIPNNLMVEHKNDKDANSKTTTTTRRSPTVGGLDLSDFRRAGNHNVGVFIDPRKRDLAEKERRSRSIKLNDDKSHQDQRPFASSRSRIRVRPISPGTGGSNLQSASAQLHGQRINQLSQSGISNQPSANRVTNLLQPTHGARPPNGSPATNSFQNPLLGSLVSTTPQTTTPLSYLISTTAFNSPPLNDDFELTERQERELQENLTNWLAVMYDRDPPVTRLLGHQFDDMILRCTMKSINCTHQRSFENSFTPTEGNCFTYRSKIRRRSSAGSRNNAGPVYEEAHLAGTNQGLELVLNLEKNEYISGSSQVGALVMIHHPNDLGYAASEATFVAPEFTTYIGLKMVNLTRLPAPYPEYCVDSWPGKFADTLTRNSTYSQQACLKICLQKTIQSHCQCQSAFLPTLDLDPASPQSLTSPGHTQARNNSKDTNQQYTNVTKPQQSQLQQQQQQQQQQQRIIICDTRKLVIRQCVRDVMFRAADRVQNCECPPKCQVVRYEKTISMARWPTREDKVSFDRGKMDVNFQNLAKVIVYFQTMTCEEITQQAVFNAAKLFSALGGIMGMYVGFSFLSVFEIFEVMSRKTWHHFTQRLSRSSCIGKIRA